MTGRSALRLLLLAALAVSALGPALLLVVWSLGRDWFFPALVPPSISTESWRAMLDPSARLASAARTSALLAAGTGLVAAAAALPVGRALARLDGWRRRLAAAAAFLPVAAPPVALAVGLQVSFLTLGLAGRPLGVLLAHAVPAVGYGSLYLFGVFAAWDLRVEDEARTLGATPRQVLLGVVVPLLRRPLAEVFALGFLISWTQVPLTLLIGAGAVRTLPMEVLGFVQAGQDRFAAAGALLLLLPAIAAFTIVGLAARRTEAVTP
jgi:putative spermidine/putrescine transport system permease protein